MQRMNYKEQDQQRVDTSHHEVKSLETRAGEGQEPWNKENEFFWLMKRFESPKLGDPSRN